MKCSILSKVYKRWHTLSTSLSSCICRWFHLLSSQYSPKYVFIMNSDTRLLPELAPDASKAVNSLPNILRNWNAKEKKTCRILHRSYDSDDGESRLTLVDAKSPTDLCVCIVSSWSKHQSNSSRVSFASLWFSSSARLEAALLRKRQKWF